MEALENSCYQGPLDGNVFVLDEEDLDITEINYENGFYLKTKTIENNKVIWKWFLENHD